MDIYLESKANMEVVNKLLAVIEDWQEVVVPRHIKFIDAYLTNNRDLSLAGEEFDYNERDMLFIFWRIQKVLQKEYSERIEKGKIKKCSYVFKTNCISLKKLKVVHYESKLNPTISLCKFRDKKLN